MRADEAPIEAPDGSDSFDLIVLGTGLVEALVAGCVPLCEGCAALLARYGALRARMQGVCVGSWRAWRGVCVARRERRRGVRLTWKRVCLQRCGQGRQERAARGPRGALRRPGAALPAGRAPPARSRAPPPQWASFGLPALRRWIADGDAAVAAADAEDAAQPPATPNEAPVRAAAAARRRFGAFAFAGPDAAPDAPPAATRGCSLDLAGPKARFSVDFNAVF